MPPSIKDIARIASVSHSTVSRALRNHPSVNRDTAARIRGIALKIGYRPNPIGRGLVTRRTFTIGVVVTSVADPFNAEVVVGIEDIALLNGYAVILANSNADPEREVKVVHAMQDRRVDGIVVMASRVGALYRPMLNELKIPIVLIDNQHPGEFVNSISIDDLAGGRAVTGHLIALGHRRIAYIGDRYGLQSDTDRCAAYRQALHNAGIRFRPQLVTQGNGKADGGQRAMEKLLALRKPPTAVFCYNDMTAIGALHCIHERGLNVPGQISVAGFDDLPICAYVEPPLTTYAQPKLDMGRQAMRLLLRLLEDPSLQWNERVKGELVVRSSTAPPPGADEAPCPHR